MFVWDEQKGQSNIEKHNLDFVYAFIVYNDPLKETKQSTRNKEDRYADIVYIEPFGACLTLVYVRRGSDIRIISFRKSSTKERRLYSHAPAKPN